MPDTARGRSGRGHAHADEQGAGDLAVSHAQGAIDELRRKADEHERHEGRRIGHNRR
jgi:hypothetical protein